VNSDGPITFLFTDIGHSRACALAIALGDRDLRAIALNEAGV
jgi:hypothetical protein